MAVSHPAGPPNARGIALVAVLWTVALLAVLAGSFLQRMRSEIRMAHNLVAAAQARFLAEAGINRAVLELYRPDPAQRPHTDGTDYAFDINGDSVRYSVQDEAARIDLNKAPPELLAGLLTALDVESGLNATLTDVILDWRDNDGLRHLHGAEDIDYQASGIPYGAKDAPFDAVEELMLLPGMSHGLFVMLAPYLTTYSDQPGIDPALAAPHVLQAIPGMTGARAADYLATRAVLREAGQIPPLPDFVDRRYLSPARGLVYTVRAQAVRARGGSAVIEATLRLQRDRTDAPFTILHWVETDHAQSGARRATTTPMENG